MRPLTRRAMLKVVGMLLFGSIPALRTLRAADVEEILRQVKERMKRNLPKIEKLKREGKVGENNRGYLHPMVELTKEELELVKTENADRKFVYTYLAKKAGVPVEQIEKIRAEQIRKRSAPGIWLQAPDGKWYKKQKDGEG